MNRLSRYLPTLVLVAAAGCTAPATSTGTGSFWSSDRGASINESLDQHGAHVSKLQQEAEAIKRDVE